jgi:hypothetical protein
MEIKRGSHFLGLHLGAAPSASAWPSGLFGPKFGPKFLDNRWNQGDAITSVPVETRGKPPFFGTG